MNQSSGIQTSPGQFNPAFTPAPGQSPQGQPVQYYVQPGQQVQPVQTAGVQVQLVQRPNQARPKTPLTAAHYKGALDADKLTEFFFLMAAWICISMYSNRQVFQADGRANFFQGITVFCWLMVIVFQVAFGFFFDKIKSFFSQPTHFTIICFVVQIILTILLIACTGNLMPLAHENTKLYDSLNERGKSTLVTLYLALIFGVYSCLSFLDDVWDLYKMIGKQKAEEQARNTEQTAQQPGTDQQQQIGAVAKPTDHDSRM